MTTYRLEVQSRKGKSLRVFFGTYFYGLEQASRSINDSLYASFPGRSFQISISYVSPPGREELCYSSSIDIERALGTPREVGACATFLP